MITGPLPPTTQNTDNIRGTYGRKGYEAKVTAVTRECLSNFTKHEYHRRTEVEDQTVRGPAKK